MNNKLKPTILYVDDEPINLVVFEASFKRNFKVITALSGEEGLKKLSQFSEVSIVISDMRMPGMNGIEFIRKAREINLQVAYFILTGFDTTKEISRAVEEKLICSYFKKPFDLNEMEGAIMRALPQS